MSSATRRCELEKQTIDLFFENVNDGGLKFIFSKYYDCIFKKNMPDEKKQEVLTAFLVRLAGSFENQDCDVQINLNIDSSVSDKYSQLLFAAAEQAIAEIKIRATICFNRRQKNSAKGHKP